MKYIFAFIIIVLNSCISSKKLKSTDNNSINKWEAAVIDLKSESDKYSIYQILKFIDDKAINNKAYNKIDKQKDYDSLLQLSNVTSGTAIFFADGENRYLITAKH